MTAHSGPQDPRPATAEQTSGEVESERASDVFAVTPFPLPGDLLAAVQLEWDAIEVTGAALPPDLPRPWEPAACTTPALRTELLAWLADVAHWLNTEHTWNPDTHLSTCWPRHPHLVHDLAVLADLRRRAGNEPSSLLLDQWQRVTLPAFLDRMRTAVGHHCAAGHQTFALTEPVLSQ